MVKRNPFLARLNQGYLFPEITKRKKALQQKEPNAEIISLGIGDTTQPIPETISLAMEEASRLMATSSGYQGYGPEGGHNFLKQAIAKTLYPGLIDPDEIFISDGAKCDIGRLQLLFGPDVKVAVQDPSYPVYVDGSVLMGQTGSYINPEKGYAGITYMPCLPENNFFPDLYPAKGCDLIYICSPNNPTGAVATKSQLSHLVSFAKQHRSVIIYDAAYAPFIQDSNLPKSIYEIKGAEEVAIEVNSFSKMVGFTGIRLGWTIVPKQLKDESGFSFHQDFSRLFATIFNGASYISQKGGLAALSEEGQKSTQSLVAYYLENAKILKQTLEKKGFTVYSGNNAPYLWVHVKQKSWDMFENLLHKAHIVTTPGSGFGPAGEGFLRFSAFAQREDIMKAAQRIDKKL